METIAITFAIFWILAIVFRWLWINFLRDFLIVLLPPSDHPHAHELESLHRDFDRAFGEKRK